MTKVELLEINYHFCSFYCYLNSGVSLTYIIYGRTALDYVNISVLIKLCCISVIPSQILSTLFMNFIYKLLIMYKRKLHGLGIMIGHFSTIYRNIAKQADVMLINTYPRFPLVLL